jgi:hypothetical protein
MAFEALKIEIEMLLEQLAERPRDQHELSHQILEKLNAMKAFGMPLPDDLVDLEAALESEFEAQARATRDDGQR